MDFSLSHTRWNCEYHIVFIPKYRRKVMYGEVRKHVGEILRKITEMYGVTLIEGHVMKDHVHMLVSIPPKVAVSSFMGQLKGKSALMIFDKYPRFRTQGDRHFWARGYYVVTVGNRDEATVRKYIQDQYEYDKNEDMKVSSLFRG